MDWTEDDNKLVYLAVRRATRGFTSMPCRYEREDLLQEGALAWLEWRDGWNFRKGSKSTYLYMVVAKKIEMLTRREHASKRRPEFTAIEYIDGITPAGVACVRSKYGQGNKKTAKRWSQWEG